MILGVDIGGANLKFAAVDRVRNFEICRSQFFPMWTDAKRLDEVLYAEFTSFGRIDALAVTMTGEMADCFINRDEGVRAIAAACYESALRAQIEQVGFYGTAGEFLSFTKLDHHLDLVASANWHAATSWLASDLSIDDGVVIDIGSTTTDLIPIARGKISTIAKTDHDRLQEGSLVYVGCGRTPVCSLVSSLQIDGKNCSVMNEVFATIDDALVVLGITSPDANDTQSADGRPRTIPMAANRIARMVGLDRTTMSPDTAKHLSTQIVNASKIRIAEAFQSIDHGGTIILGGHCDALFKPSEERPIVRIAERLGVQQSRCLPALAVARLFNVLDSGTSNMRTKDLRTS